MEGFHVEGPRKLEVVRSRTAMGYIQKGQPGMANLVDREWGCANEHESMELWAEAAGRGKGEPACGLGGCTFWFCALIAARLSAGSASISR